MKPDKVTRNAVTFWRYWTATVDRPDDRNIRPFRLVQGFESRKDAESACREICRNHPHWKDAGMCVVDLATMFFAPDCILASELDAHLDSVCRAYEARRAKDAGEGSSAAASA